MGILKSVGYPLGLLLQILAVIYLSRGSPGYSRSARNWFLIVLGADIGSTLYRLYELMTVDFRISNPFLNSTGNDGYFGQRFISLMWGLRRIEDAFMQEVFCKAFFVILYFPIHLSPIALTFNSLIRCYCVKNPLRAKDVLTVCVDRALMVSAAGLSMIISLVVGLLAIDGWSNHLPATTTLDEKIFYGDCAIPRLNMVNTDKELVLGTHWFMLAVIFIICALNFLSAVVIIKVLRGNEAGTSAADSKAEMRATAIILGMNVTLLICFFGSRLMVLISGMINKTYCPVAYVVLERTSTYLFNIPYYTNVLFIVGFTRNFYAFFIPCLASKNIVITTAAGATTMKTMAESKID